MCSVETISGQAVNTFLEPQTNPNSNLDLRIPANDHIEATLYGNTGDIPYSPTQGAAQHFTISRGCEHDSLLQQVAAMSLIYFQEDITKEFKHDMSWQIEVATLQVGTHSEVIGFIYYRKRAKVQTVEISKLFVSKAQRRHGVGRKLIKRVITFSKASSLAVIALWAYPHAIHFYSTLGFRAIEHLTSDDPKLANQSYMEFQLPRRSSMFGKSPRGSPCGSPHLSPRAPKRSH